MTQNESNVVFSSFTPNQTLLHRFIAVLALGCFAGSAFAGGSGEHTHGITAFEETPPLTEPYYPEILREATQNLGAAAQYGQWSDVQSWPVVAIHTNLLPNGKVLAWDATPDDSDDDPHTTSSFSTRVSLYDPITNIHIPTNNDTNSDLFCAGSAHLWDGRILFAGGDSGTSGDNGPLDNTNIYHYKTNTWRQVTNMATPRWYASVAALPNGEMLTFAGAYEPNPVAEVFQFNETWRPLTIETPYLYPEFYQWLQATPEGNVISFGPQNTIATIDTDSNGLWTTGGQRDDFEIRTYGSYAMYDVGKILVSGGGDLVESTDSSVLIDTATQQTTTTGAMNHKRTQHDLTILADGSVLAIGGNDDGTYLYSPTGGVYTPEIWSPETGQWRVMNDMQVDRQYHSTALLLADGRVLSGGGGICGDCNLAGYREQNAEIFSPPYLFSTGNTLAVRPVIDAAPDKINYASSFFLSTSDNAQIEKLHLIKLGAATHSQNQDQRLIPLQYTVEGAQLRAQSPLNRNIAPPGHYMLIAVNSSGVPSIAKILLVGQPLVKSGDLISNSLLAGELDEFVLTSTDADSEIVVSLDGVDTSAILQVQDAESLTAGTAPACTVTGTAGNRVQCRLPNRAATRWYISVQSGQITNYTLEPQLQRSISTDTNFALSGVDSVTDRVSLNGWNYYEITAAPGQADITVSLSEQTSDADLYVQQNVRPIGTVDESGSFYCASYLTGTRSESCAISNAQGSSWIVGVYGFRESSYRLSTTATVAPISVTDIGLGDTSVTLAADQWQYFRFPDSAGQQLTASLVNLTGDIDLYLRNGAAPRQSVEQWGVYDCASFSGAQTDERCVVNGVVGSEWIFGLYGNQAASGSLQISVASADSAAVTPLIMQIGKNDVLSIKNSTAGGGEPIAPGPETPTEGGEGAAPSSPAPEASNPAIVTGRGTFTPCFLGLLVVLTGLRRRSRK